jgi:hypothetical protein
MENLNAIGANIHAFFAGLNDLLGIQHPLVKLVWDNTAGLTGALAWFGGQAAQAVTQFFANLSAPLPAIGEGLSKIAETLKGLFSLTPPPWFPGFGGGGGGGASGASLTPISMTATGSGRNSQYILQAARAYGVPPAVLAALQQVEGSGDRATSPAGAMGPMQVMPFNFRAGEDPFDLQTNFNAAARLTAGNYQRFGNWDSAAAAYFGAVDSSGRPTMSSDGNVTGVEYVRRFNEALREQQQIYRELNPVQSDNVLTQEEINRLAQEYGVIMPGVTSSQQGLTTAVRDNDQAVNVWAVSMHNGTQILMKVPAVIDPVNKSFGEMGGLVLSTTEVLGENAEAWGEWADDVVKAANRASEAVKRSIKSVPLKAGSNQTGTNEEFRDVLKEFQSDGGSIPNFHGGGFMPHDGLAYLHKGEKVLTPEQQGGNTYNVTINAVEGKVDQRTVREMFWNIQQEEARMRRVEVPF